MEEEIKDIHLTDEQYEGLEEIIGGENVYFRDGNNVGFDGILYFSTILKAGKYLDSIVHPLPTEEEVRKVMLELRQLNINSSLKWIWHQFDERPKDDTEVLVIDTNDIFHCGRFDDSANVLWEPSDFDWTETNIKKWCYLKDLVVE